MNLLFPFGKEKTWSIPEDTSQHLAMEELVDMIGVTKEEKDIVRKVFSVLPFDEDTVTYRQEIIKDLIDSNEICDELGVILGKLELLNEFKVHNHFLTEKRASLWDLIDYMSEMDIYIQIVEELNLLFENHPMNSAGLKDIAALLKEVIDLDQIDNLKKIVASLKTEVAALKSVTVGINLSPELYPEEVRVLQYSTIPVLSPYEKTAWGLSIAAQRRISYREHTPFMKHICADMEKHLSKSVQTYKSELKKYVNFKGYFLLDICNDLRFYLLVARLGQKLINSEYDICFPKVSTDYSYVNIKGLYNLRLVAKKQDNIVENDFSFTDKEKVFILTGPNRGGKTMLTQAVGIDAFLAGQGMFVVAKAYEGFLFNRILTHFPADENETIDLGRLGEEAVRIQRIIREADNRTLVLLNETYSSTSAGDGLYLAKDLVHILKHKEIPTIFNTHLHELARNTDEMNKWDGEGEVVSLTMEIVNNENTYRVLRKEPDGKSFAHNIAYKYGVTYEQMLEE